MPDKVAVVVAGIDPSSVKIGPLATAVHTATEEPERSQLTFRVLCYSQSRTRPDTGASILRIINSGGIDDSRWALHNG